MQSWAMTKDEKLQLHRRETWSRFTYRLNLGVTVAIEDASGVHKYPCN